MKYQDGRGVTFAFTVALALLVNPAGADANDYAACVQAGQRHDALAARLRLAMQASSGCAGEPGFEAGERAHRAYASTPRGQACREARSICENLKPEVGLHHCGRFLRGGAGYPDQIAHARRINAALDNAYGACPAQ